MAALKDDKTEISIYGTCKGCTRMEFSTLSVEVGAKRLLCVCKPFNKKTVFRVGCTLSGNTVALSDSCRPAPERNRLCFIFGLKKLNKSK